MLFGIILNSTAQNIVRQSLSCLGSNNITEGVFLRQTVGQSSNTSIISNDNGLIRQGFLQPISLKGVKYYAETNLELIVYPNPTENIFYINIEGEQEDYTILVYDVLGKAIYSRMILNKTNTLINSIKWYPGIYIIKVFNKNKLLSTKKIIKTK